MRCDFWGCYSFNVHTSHISPLPKSPSIALSDPNWRVAMYDEYNTLVKNNTWILVPKPPNANVVRSMWLFRHKYHADGSLSMYKARLVANGRTQQVGIDCDDTFSLVVKPATIRTILSLVLSLFMVNNSGQNFRSCSTGFGEGVVIFYLRVHFSPISYSLRESMDASKVYSCTCLDIVWARGPSFDTPIQFIDLYISFGICLAAGCYIPAMDVPDVGKYIVKDLILNTPPVSPAEIHAVEKERKERTILLMAIPNEHLRRFHGMDDAKEIWEAIRTRFGGNTNSKKMQKAILKQQFKRDYFYQNQGAGKKKKNQNCLLTMDDGVVNWGEHIVEEEETNHALMAISSNTMQPITLNEQLTFQENEIYAKDENLKRYRRIGMKALKEKEQLKKTVDSWKDSSKNLRKLIDSSMSSTSKVGLGYEIKSNNEVLSYEEEMNRSVFKCTEEDYINKPLYNRFTKTNSFKGVPHPLTGDYTPKPQEEIDDSLYVYGKKGPQKPEISDSDDNSTEHSTCQSNDSEGSCGNTSEHSSESESESISVPNEMSTSKSVITNEKVMSELQEVEPSCAKHVKTPRQQMKNQGTSEVKGKNWNKMMERELGEGYSFIKKKCFVCGSLSHLIKDCDYYEKKMAREAEFKKQRVFNTGNRVAKPVWTNANRVNHANQFVPKPVQLNGGRPNANSVRPNVNTGRVNVNYVRSNVNTSRTNVNPVRLTVNTGSSNDHPLKTYASVVNNSGSLINSLQNSIDFAYVKEGDKIWQTATANTLADGTLELHATIDIIMYTIIEASIRNKLQLADASGITMLPNNEIFEGMGNMGYPTDGSFTFWKSFFTPQWRFLVHHILHCISSKSGGWDQFGSNIATALISQSQPSSSTIPVQSPPPITAPIPASTPTPIPETDLEPMEHTFEEPSPAHQHFSPPQEHAQGQMTVDDLLQLVPQLMTRIDSLEKDLKQTKLTMGSAIVKLVKKVKKLEGLVTPSKTTVNASGEEQVEDISPTTLEAAKTLSRVASQKPKSIDKGRRYKRRKETKGKKVVTSLDFQEEVSTGYAEGVNTGSIKVSTVSGQVSTVSGQVSTDSIKKTIPSPDKGQREGKAPMIIEEAPKKTKEQILQEEASLAEAIRLDTLEKEEEAKQVFMDSPSPIPQVPDHTPSKNFELQSRDVNRISNHKVGIPQSGCIGGYQNKTIDGRDEQHQEGKSNEQCAK
ncbi:ribonuclease H-like domain-containing protein [Tanacetum coccineum]